MKTAFMGATLIDATGAAPRPDSAVVVDDGRISWVGDSADFDPGDAEVVDVGRKWLIPGLLDANVHLVIHTEPEVLLPYDPGDYDDLVVEAAQVALKAGFTTVFDTWGPLVALKRVRDRINAGEVTGSRIFCAGNIIGNSGPWGPDFFPNTTLSTGVVDAVNQEWEQGAGAELTWMAAEEAREAVRQYVATKGIDFVKFTGSSHAHGRFLAFSPDVQRAFVEEAHEAGLIAQACTMNPEALKVVIDAGVDLLQHGDVSGLRPHPDETIDLIAERQIPCVAFLSTERFIDAFAERGATWHGTPWVEVLRTKDSNDRRLIDRGAKLMMAHDFGLFGPTAKTSPFFAEWQSGIPDYPYYLGSGHITWMRAAFERAIDPMAALQAITRNTAEGYHRLDDIGTVEVGKRADLLVLDADPFVAAENYGRIAHVVKDGKIVDRDRLPEKSILTDGVDPAQWQPLVA